MDTEKFCATHNITLDYEMTDHNPNMGDPNWPAHHYKVTLKRDKTIEGERVRRQLTTYFSMGYGISHEPYAHDVIDCLASDAAGWHNARDFNDWCGDYGYDTDSIRALRTYETLQKQAKHLQRFMGDLYDDLLWNTERL